MISISRLEAGRLLLGAAAWAWAAAAPAISLTEAMRSALEHDHTVAVARAQYEADRQGGDIERAALLPTVDLSVKGDYATTSLDGVFGLSSGGGEASASVKDDYPEWSGRIEVRQALLRFDWSDRRNRAKALDAQAEITLADAQADVLARTAQVYLDIELAQDVLVQAEAEAGAVRGSLEDTQRRFDVELVPGNDLKEAQARDDLSQARLISARRDLADAIDAFADVVGVKVSGVPGMREDIIVGPLQPSDPEAWIRLAQDQRPTLVNARLAVEIAKADAASMRASSLPQIDAVASGGRSDNSHYVFGQVSDDARIGLELRVPIYAGGANRAQNRRADALLEARQAELQRLQADTERDIRKLFRSVESRAIEVKAYRRSLDSAIAAEQAVRNGYEAGTRTITEKLDALSRIAQVTRDWNVSRYSLLTDSLSLKRIAGTLRLDDFFAVDKMMVDTPPKAQGPDGSTPMSAP